MTCPSSHSSVFLFVNPCYCRSDPSIPKPGPDIMTATACFAFCNDMC